MHSSENTILCNSVCLVSPQMCLCTAEAKVTGGSRALGMAALGLKRKAQEVLIWYTEERLMK